MTAHLGNHRGGAHLGPGRGRATVQVRRFNPAQHRAVARIVKHNPEYRALAHVVYVAVLLAVGAHNRTGALQRSIHLVQGDVDWRVEADGTGYDFHSEFGHYVYYDEQGFYTSKANAKSKKWVKGINAFRKVVAAFGGF